MNKLDQRHYGFANDYQNIDWAVEVAWHNVEIADYVGPLKVAVLYYPPERMAVPIEQPDVHNTVPLKDSSN